MPTYNLAWLGVDNGSGIDIAALNNVSTFSLAAGDLIDLQIFDGSTRFVHSALRR